MNNDTKSQINSGIQTKYTFFCHHCESISKVYVENWVKNNEGPYKIELIQHEGNAAIIVGEININKKPDGELVKFNYCGDCGQMIQPPVDKDYITIMESYNPITSKN